MYIITSKPVSPIKRSPSNASSAITSTKRETSFLPQTRPRLTNLRENHVNGDDPRRPSEGESSVPCIQKPQLTTLLARIDCIDT